MFRMAQPVYYPFILADWPAGQQRFRTASALLTLGLTAGLAGCHDTPPPKPTVQTVYVTEVQPAAGSSVTRSFSAVIASDAESTLSFKTAGRISQKLVETGQSVTAGQVLYRMEPDDYNHSYEASLNQWKAAQVDARQQQIEADRLSRLVKDGSVAQADWERQQARATAAAAGRDALRQQADLSRSRVTDTTIRSPFAGVVTKTLVETGQVVAAGQPVVTVAKTGELEAVVNIPEQMVQNLQNWQATLENWKDQDVATLRLKEVAGAASPYSRTYEAKYAGVPSSYKLGMTARMNLSENRSGKANSFSIPATSIVKRNGSPMVWVVQPDNTHVRSQPVNVLQYSDSQAEVTGLTAGQTIVSLGAFKLNDQEPVNPVRQQAM